MSATTFHTHTEQRMVLTLRLCVMYGLYGPCGTLTDLFRITEVERVYSAVRTESLYKADKFSLYRVQLLGSGNVYIDLWLKTSELYEKLASYTSLFEELTTAVCWRRLAVTAT